MFKFFTSDLRRNLIKILCLALGLGVGFLLVAKIYFEQSYDSFFPDVDRIYMIKYSAVHNGESQVYPNTPGGIAPEVKRNISQVEVATRITDLTDDLKVKLNDGRTYEMPYMYLADSCFFDVFKTEILEGDPHEALAVKDQVVIPQSLADKIGGNVVGQQLSVVEFGNDYKMTIGGVYKDFPLNSTISNSIYLSLPTIGKFMMDGRENLLGNDRYRSYVVLAKDSDPDKVTNMMYEHLKTKIDEEAFRLYDLKVVLGPLSGNYSSQAGVRNMSWMLGLLALIMLMCAGLNYLLIVIGQLSARGKEMAIRKCYGTGKKSIFKMMMSESIFFLLVSLLLAVLLSFSFSDLCKELLGYTPKELFSTGRVWIVEGLVCLGLLIITGIIPSIIYSRTPVSQAFRPAVHGRRIWKLVLLAVQFFATGLILCLLVLVGRQYSMVGKLDMGLDYENIGIFYRFPMSDERTSTVMKELKKLPFVEGVASADNDPTHWQSGNNIWTEGNEENNVNISDQEYVNPELFDVMGIEFLQGSTFSENLDSTVNQIVVDERMIDVLQKYFGETDNDIVGKSIYITGHSNVGPSPIFTIVGVVGNVRRGGFESGNADNRAEVFFPSHRVRAYVFIRFTELTPENLNAAQKELDSINDGDEIYITPYKMRIDAKRNMIKKFGMSVMVVGIAIILIALIGLIGYVGDEVNRRAKEIAIRKVNGTDAWKIVRLFCLDVLKVALPSLILGGAAAIIIGQRWLSQFTDRVSLSPSSMIGCLFLLLILIMCVVVVNTLRVARSNPIKHLRSE
ncbi:MAG: ABC transporter permease [Lachnospiraceae bacterium]|nr:ABC transporter permease [Lachnospiraceae bacterium]